MCLYIRRLVGFGSPDHRSIGLVEEYSVVCFRKRYPTLSQSARKGGARVIYCTVKTTVALWTIRPALVVAEAETWML